MNAYRNSRSACKESSVAAARFAGSRSVISWCQRLSIPPRRACNVIRMNGTDISASSSMEPSGLIKHLAEEGVDDGHSESEPSFGLINVFDVSCTGRQPTRERQAHSTAHSRDRDFEVVGAAHEMQRAASFIHVE